MKDPQTLKFTKSHEWVSSDGTVGISDHAQKEITDVVFVDLPKVGKEIKAGEAIAVVESVKAAFDIYAPVSGTIKAVNDEVSKNPGAVNQAPYGDGWLFSIEKSGSEDSELMDHTAYQSFIQTNGH